MRASDVSPSAAAPQRLPVPLAASLVQVAVLGVVTLGYLAVAGWLLVATPRGLQEQHFTLQAAAWLAGRLELTVDAGLLDAAFVGGRTYLTYGPLPALLLLPWVWAGGPTVPQAALALALTAVNFSLLWALGGRFGLPRLDRWWLACSYLFGTAYLGVSLLPISAYLSQVAATAGLLLALVAVVTPDAQLPTDLQRWWCCGMGVTLAGLARPQLFLAILPFAMWLGRDPVPRSVRARRLVGLLTPVLVAAFAVGWYNFVRFGSWWEGGYRFHNWGSRGAPTQLFRFAYVPANLHELLLALPEVVTRAGRPVFPYLKPSGWGISIALTSPVLGWLLLRRPRGWLSGVCWLATALLLVPVLTYAGIGYWQIGYRYALDFLPFLYVLVLLTVKKTLPMAVKLLMLAGVAVNAWLVAAALLS